MSQSIWKDKMKETIIKKSLDAQQFGNTEKSPRAPQPITELDNRELTKISGILTSNLRAKPSSQVEYMAFFRPYRDCEEHTIEECETSKCQNCERPVVFRIDNPDNSKCCNYQNNWHNLGCKEIYLKPKLKKSDSVILEGEFEPSKKSNRPSFTCYSYRVLTK